MLRLVISVCFWLFTAQLSLAQQSSQEIKLRGIKKYDRQIVHIIKQNSDLSRPHRIDSILAQTRRLDFVKDCFWDGCYGKIMIYPGYHHYGVVMNINGKKIERCYYILSSRLKYIDLKLSRKFYIHKLISTRDNRLDYKSASFCPGFVDSARVSCK